MSAASVAIALADLDVVQGAKTATCGQVACSVFHRFTGSALSRAKPTQLNGSVVKQLSGNTIRPGHVRIVSLSIARGGTFKVDHVMVFILTGEGLVHTCQAFFPLIRRPHAFELSAAEFHRALATLASAQTWSPKYGDAFDVLTRVSHARRNMGVEDGFVVSQDPLPEHENIGAAWMQQRKTQTGAFVPSWQVVSRDVVIR